MDDDTFFELQPADASGVARLTLDRPERLNTMAPPFFPALRDAVRALDDAGRTRVLVIASTGKHFSAGMSLDVFQRDDLGLQMDSARARLQFRATLQRLMECFDALDRARFPVVCAVQGGCVGGALDLACACDIRVCTADAFFCVQEIHIGMAADLGTLQRLPKLLPQGLARQLAYTGERLDATRAAAAGFVNAVLPDAAALREHAEALARDIAAKSPLAMAASKAALNHARDHGTAQSLEHMTWLQSALLDVNEMRAALAAQQARRDAAFEPLEPRA
jgi:enoyl-CoA hydratase